MRLRCKVDVGGRGKAVKGSAAVGSGKDGAARLTISTTAEPRDRAFLLPDNVATLHANFLHDGKLGIVFRQPAISVYLSKAEPKELEMFTRLVRIGVKGGPDADSNHPPLSRLTPTQARHLSSPLKSLKLNGAAEYRKKLALIPREKFPVGLSLLSIRDAGIRFADRYWNRLAKLTRLELVGNNFGDHGLDDLRLAKFPLLRHLNLSRNGLTRLGEETMDGLSEKLAFLDLSDNDLRALPPGLARLSALGHLNVALNSLGELPPSLGHLPGLRELLAADNPIRAFPAAFRRLKLNSIDLTASAIGPEDLVPRSTPPAQPQPPSLFDAAAQVTRDSGQSHSAHLPPFVRRCLESMWNCDGCSRTVIPSLAITASRPLNLRLISTTVHIDQNLGPNTCIKGSFCGNMCANNFLNNGVY